MTKDKVTVEEVDRVMKENNSYCISYFCEDLTMEWKLNMELCKCDVEKKNTSTSLESDEITDNKNECQSKNTSKLIPFIYSGASYLRQMDG